MAKERMEESPFIPVRIERKLHERIGNVAKREKKSITSIMNGAVENFLEKNEFSYEDLMKIIESNPALEMHKKKMEEFFKDCPSDMCGQLIKIIGGRNSSMFEETKDTLAERVKKLTSENIYGVFITFVGKNVGINHITEIFDSLLKEFKGRKIKLSAGLKNDPKEEKIFLFVAYKNKNDKKEKEINKKQGDTN